MLIKYARRPAVPVSFSTLEVISRKPIRRLQSCDAGPYNEPTAFSPQPYLDPK